MISREGWLTREEVEEVRYLLLHHFPLDKRANPLCDMALAAIENEGKADSIRHIDGTQVRPSVVRFARMMENQLRRNDSRGGWSHCDRIYFMERLQENLQDLSFNLKADAVDAIQRTCADLGNFAMMLAENEHLANYALAPKPTQAKGEG